MSDFLNKPVGQMSRSELTRLISQVISRTVPPIPANVLALADMDRPVTYPATAANGDVLTYDSAKGVVVAAPVPPVTTGTVGSDGLTPGAPVVSLVSGPGWIQAKWDPVAGTSDPVKYKVFIRSGSAPTTADATYQVAYTPQTTVVLNKLAGGTQISDTGGPYYVVVKAISFLSGLNIDSTVQNATPAPIDATVTTLSNIAAGNITSGFLNSARIAAGSIDADQLKAELALVSAMVAGDIDHGNVQFGYGALSVGGGLFTLDPSFLGIRAFQDDGVTPSFNLDSTTGNAYLKGSLDFGIGSSLDSDYIDLHEQTSTGFLTPTIRQAPHIQNAGGGSGSTTLAWSYPTLQGSCLVLVLVINDKDGTAPTPTTPTNWTLAKSERGGSSWGPGVEPMAIYVYTYDLATSVSGNMTISFGDTVYYAVQALEITGVSNGAASVDKTASNEGHTNAPDGGTTAATTQAQEIALSFIATESQALDPTTVTNGFTLYTQNAGTDSGIQQVRCTTLTKSLSATGAVNTGATTSGGATDYWIGVTITLKAAAGVPDPATPPADTVRQYAKDIGTGQTREYAIDNMGYKHDLQLPAGVLLPYAGSGAPDGFLLCYGQSLLRADYPSLFAAIGTTYGSVDGTHFTLPDMRGRIPVTLDNMGGIDANNLSMANTLGGTGGEERHTLTTSELASHTHVVKANQQTNTTTGGGATRLTNLTNSGSDSGTSDATGGDASHNNLQPYILMNYIIKY